MGKPVTIKKINDNITSAGTAERLSAVDLFVPWFRVHAPSGNTGVMYIGDSDVDNTAIPIAAGSTVKYDLPGELDAKEHDHYNLKEVYFDGGTSNDAIIVEYPAEV